MRLHLMRLHRVFAFCVLALATGVQAISPATPATPASSATSAASGYAGQESRDIKSLSAQEVESLLAGKGMGFAKAAELNGYPGPAHVLELSDDLELTSEQRHRTKALFASMEQEAMTLGKALVEAERELDRLFADRSVTPESLSAVLTRVAALQANLRGLHLQAHLDQARILSPGQTARYVELRGYAGRRHMPDSPSPGHHLPGHGSRH